MLAEHDHLLFEELFITKEMMVKSCSEIDSENVGSKLAFCLFF